MPDRESRIKVGADVDTGSINKATSELSRISASYKDIASAAAQVGLSVEEFAARTGLQLPGVAADTQKLATTTTNAAGEIKQSTAKIAQSYDQVKTSIKAADKAQVEMTARLKTSPISSGYNTLRASGAAFSNLTGDPTVTRAASLIGLAELGSFGIALAAISLPLKLITDARERETKAVEATVAALKKESAARSELTKTIGAGDPGGIGVRIANIQAQINNINETEIAKLRQEQTNLFEQARQDIERSLQPGQVISPAASTREAQAALEIPGKYTENRDKIAGFVAEIGALNLEILNLQTQGIRGAKAIADINRELTNMQKARDLARNGSLDEVRQQITDFQEDLVVNGNQIADTNDKIIDARAAGNTVEEDALKIFKAQLLATREQIEADLHFLSIQGVLITTGREAAQSVQEIGGALADLIRQKYAQQLADQLSGITEGIARQVALSDAIRTATLESSAERLHGIREEQAAISAAIPELEELAKVSPEAAEKLGQARARLGELSNEFFQFVTQVIPAAQRRALAELQTDQEKIRADSQVKLNEIEASRLEADSKALDARNDAFADSERKRGESLNDLAEKQAAEREKIERKSGVAIANAVYGRNALAAYLAIQQKQQDLLDLTERGKERAGEIDKQARREHEQAERNFDKALRSAQDAADKSARLERERAIREINERINAYNQQMALLDLFNVEGTQQMTQFVNNALAALRNLANSVRAILSGASGGGNGGIGAPLGLPMPPGWVPFPAPTVPQGGWGGVGGAVGGLFSASRAQAFPVGTTSGSRDLSGAPARGLFPPQVSPPTPIYRAAQASQQAAGAGSSYTFHITGSKTDARAIAKQIEPLIRSVTRDEVVEVANTLMGGRH